ncbi:MAG: DUF1015 domain-containing protein [Acidobacteria bacterium]|nr:MAG: DUF1015 domain-containing protein [Acidobacteriota bacterium]
MAVIQPFKALRPDPQLAEQVAARPYDVLNSDEARLEAKNNPFSFLHITKAEIDLPPGIHAYSKLVYEKAKQNLEQFIQKDVLLRDEKPCYYIYQLAWKGRTQTGLACLSSVDDYSNDVIKKHEFTRPEKEKDRIDHMLATGAQTGNVFLTYRDVAEINALLDTWKSAHKPIYNFSSDDEVKHSVWIINDEKTIQSLTDLFKQCVPHTYIADGHHRAASAAKVSRELPENANAQYFLTTIFPTSQLAILDYNRLINDVNGLSRNELTEKLEADFTIERSNAAFAPTRLHQFGLYIDHQWYKLEAKEGTYRNDPVGVLDVSILSNNVLDKILGIKDQRTDKRIDFVGGIRGLGELEKRVDSGEMKLAFSLHPVSISQLLEIADSGSVMPPKSTWFEPKLRDGLLTHSFS